MINAAPALTRRAVLWLGQTCNLRCYFCYFLDRIENAHHPEHAFMSLGKAKEICLTLRKFYKCDAIDIQGGEPTIYPQILELIVYCRSIGLAPTLITNGIYLAQPGRLEEFKKAGIADFLCSLHGIGKVHDEVVGRDGAYEKLICAIEKMNELEIPVRINCTLTKPVIAILPQIAKKAIELKVLVVNFIAFNPFDDQKSGKRSALNVASYSEIKPKLSEALDLLEAAGIEANVRYLPLCFAEERHRKNFYNLQQLSYDPHEWDYQSWQWTGQQPQRMSDGPLSPTHRLGFNDRHFMYRSLELRDWVSHNPLWAKSLMKIQHALAMVNQIIFGKKNLYRKEANDRAKLDLGYKYHLDCQKCSLRKICDGFHGDYAEIFGLAEAAPVLQSSLVDDPVFFVRNQNKLASRI